MEPIKLKIKSKDNFRFIHGTIPVDSPLRLRYSNEVEKEKKKLIYRILRTETGGCFLVTGYRGVGKTCFVDGVIKDIGDEATNRTVLPIKLNIAKDVKALDLMHQIIRNLYEEIEKNKNKIGGKTLLEYIQKAYLRTILKMRCSSDVAQKEVISKAMGSGAEGEIKLSIWGPLSGRGKTQISKERGSTKEDTHRIVDEISYLDYDEKSAEADILKVSGLLRQKNSILSIVVLDEIDKLIEGNEGAEREEDKGKVRNIISSLKNVFSASGLIFTMVAGKDFYDIWTEDREREDSIYESVFSYDLYLGKDWDIGERILQKYVSGYETITEDSIVEDSIVKDFKYYLNFKARGIFRKAIHEFNNYIEWEDKTPYLESGEQEIKKVHYYGGLQRLLQDEIDTSIKGKETSPISPRRMDRLKYIAYNRIINETIGGKEFGEDLKGSLKEEFKEDSTLIDGLFQRLIKVLENNNWIEKSEGVYHLTLK